MTYEQAMEEYKALCSKDRITGATARLFCDYAGIILSVLPVFLGVTRCLRDKRAQVSQVIFSHRACALVIIASRYLANVCMAFLPVVLTAFGPGPNTRSAPASLPGTCSVHSRHNGVPFPLSSYQVSQG